MARPVNCSLNLRPKKHTIVPRATVYQWSPSKITRLHYPGVLNSGYPVLQVDQSCSWSRGRASGPGFGGRFGADFGPERPGRRPGRCGTGFWSVRTSLPAHNLPRKPSPGTGRPIKQPKRKELPPPGPSRNPTKTIGFHTKATIRSADRPGWGKGARATLSTLCYA